MKQATQFELDQKRRETERKNFTYIVMAISAIIGGTLIQLGYYFS